MNSTRRPLALAAAVLLAAAACTDDPEPLFEPTGTGEVSGRLFFDADNNGVFTPVGGDTLLSGVRVQVRGRGTTDVLAEGTTDAQGMFRLTDLPSGTHDVFVVRDEAVTGPLVFCVNPTRASVYIDEVQFVSVAAKRGCVIRIEAAEALAEGSPITIEGAVSAPPGTYRSDNLYLQDRTGGIMVFGIPGGLGLQLGDTVEITGTLGNFGTELQVISPQVAPNVRAGAPPTPVDRTAAEINAAVTAGGPKAPMVGTLVTVRRATVGAFSAGGGRNATLTDATGSIILRLDGNALTTIGTAGFQAGRCYDVTGILGIFNADRQVKPRFRSDVVEVPCS